MHATWDLIAGGKGALMVNDVHAYEMMKLRLLNAGHSALSYASYLAGKSAAVVFVLPIWLRIPFWHFLLQEMMVHFFWCDLVASSGWQQTGTRHEARRHRRLGFACEKRPLFPSANVLVAAFRLRWADQNGLCAHH